MSRSSSQVSQNVDNFLSEKSSTRLHKPPGGGSTVGSLIFGGGGCDESPFAGHQRRGSISRPKEEAPEQANPYAKDSRRGSGAYQQQQSSSGPYPGYQQPTQQQSSSGPYPGYQQPTQQPLAQGNQQYAGGYQQQQQQQSFGGAPAAGGRQMSSNSYATGSNQNAGNVLTERRITRIHAPPGGKTSITFG